MTTSSSKSPTALSVVGIDIGNGFEVAFDTVIGGLGDVNLGNLGDIVVDLGSLVFDNFIGR